MSLLLKAESLRGTNAESLQAINVEINGPSAESLRATSAESTLKLSMYKSMSLLLKVCELPMLKVYKLLM